LENGNENKFLENRNENNFVKVSQDAPKTTTKISFILKQLHHTK